MYNLRIIKMVVSTAVENREIYLSTVLKYFVFLTFFTKQFKFKYFNI